MKINRRRIAVAAGLLVCLGGAGWAWSGQPGKSPSTSAYQFAAVDEGPITQVVMANGSLQPVSTVTVGSAVSGTVVERLVDFNDRVRQGQVLARLDPSAFEARERQAQAQLSAAEARLAHAQGNLQRSEALLSDGFISTPQRDQHRREADAALAERKLAQAQLDAARNDLQRSVIRAPVDGVVIKRSVDVGQTVAASFQTPELFLIARDLTEMVIHTNVSEADVGLIREGQPVRFLVDAFPAREFEGRIKQFRLNPTSTQGVVTYTVVVDVPNPDGELKPGMTAQTRIVVASKPRALRVRTAALRFVPGDSERKPGKPQAPSARADDDGALGPLRDGQRVFQLYTEQPGGTLKAHDVTVGIANSRYTELIDSGLKVGDAVIIRRHKTKGGDAS